MAEHPAQLNASPSTRAAVNTSQRFSASRPCPVCGGHSRLPSKRDVRCYGFLSADGEYAHCTREEHAIGLTQENGGSYAHRLRGDCKCGQRHGGESVSIASRRDKPEEWRPFEVYDYGDFEKGRFEGRSGKSFSWRRKGVQGWPAGNSGAVMDEQPLYGVFLAIDNPGLPVVLCEGEKAANALLAASHVAVSGAGGAKQRKFGGALEVLRGRDVFLWPDNDKDGADLMAHLARLLLPIAASLRVIQWASAPVKGDAADAVAQGADVQGLLDGAVESTEVYELNEIDELSTDQGRVNSFNTFNSYSAPPENEYPDLPPPAFEGLAGDIVQRLAVFTEADPVGVLASILAFVGNAIGTGAHCMVGATKHSLKFWPVLVGDTAVARKGDGWKLASFVASLSDPAWCERVRIGGLSSGEGLIWEIRDPILKQEPVKEKGRIVGYEEVITDHGTSDKRLTVVETEFARVLQSMERKGNTLSSIVRQAYDGDELRTMTKNTPANSTGAHVTIIAHITREELLRNLYEVEISNGFANRFTFLAVRRSKLLPEPDVLQPHVVADLTGQLAERLEMGRDLGVMQRTTAAKPRWREIYEELANPPEGMVGALVARAAPQILRLSAIYAVLDGRRDIHREHLERAYSLYQYAEKSARYIFGETLGDAIADTIAGALQSNGRLTRTDISGLFGRNASSARIASALQALFRKGKAHPEADTEGVGRPVEWWVWNG